MLRTTLLSVSAQSEWLLWGPLESVFVQCVCVSFCCCQRAKATQRW